jgi:hypothetical protein
MSNLVSVRLETVLVLVQDRCTVCAKRTIGSKLFWTHPIVLLRDKVQWKPVSVCLEIMLILTHDRYMVCVECTIRSKIILDAPNGAPR